jgi:hypothetical protein
MGHITAEVGGKMPSILSSLGFTSGVPNSGKADPELPTDDMWGALIAEHQSESDLILADAQKLVADPLPLPMMPAVQIVPVPSQNSAPVLQTNDLVQTPAEPGLAEGVAMSALARTALVSVDMPGPSDVQAKGAQVLSDGTPLVLAGQTFGMATAPAHLTKGRSDQETLPALQPSMQSQPAISAQPEADQNLFHSSKDGPKRPPTLSGAPQMGEPAPLEPVVAGRDNIQLVETTIATPNRPTSGGERTIPAPSVAQTAPVEKAAAPVASGPSPAAPKDPAMPVGQAFELATLGARKQPIGAPKTAPVLAIDAGTKIAAPPAPKASETVERTPPLGFTSLTAPADGSLAVANASEKPVAAAKQEFPRAPVAGEAKTLGRNGGQYPAVTSVGSGSDETVRFVTQYQPFAGDVWGNRADLPAEAVSTQGASNPAMPLLDDSTPIGAVPNLPPRAPAQNALRIGESTKPAPTDGPKTALDRAPELPAGPALDGSETAPVSKRQPTGRDNTDPTVLKVDQTLAVPDDVPNGAGSREPAILWQAAPVGQGQEVTQRPEKLYPRGLETAFSVRWSTALGKAADLDLRKSIKPDGKAMHDEPITLTGPDKGELLPTMTDTEVRGLGQEPGSRGSDLPLAVPALPEPPPDARTATDAKVGATMVETLPAGLQAFAETGLSAADGLSGLAEDVHRPTAQNRAETSAPVHQASAALAERIAQTPSGQMEITLRPEELGALRFDMRQEGEALVITLSAERPETLDLMRRHLPELMADLKQLGVQNSNLSFGQWGERQDQPAPSGQNFPDDPPAMMLEPSPIAPNPPRLMASGGLYMRL